MSIFIGMGRYNYTNALAVLSEWANGQGYSEVRLDHHDISEISFDYKKILIEGKYSKEFKFYLLLHELGHHQLRKDWIKFEKTLPVMAYAEHVHLVKKDGARKYKRRITYNVSCMEEEFKAWDEGYKLGKRLGLRINDAKWNELKSRCLISYMRYYSTKKF